MTRYVHDYDPSLKSGALVKQIEIEGGTGSTTWSNGKFTGDGSTSVFNLPSTPSTNSLLLYVNGQLQADQATVAVGYDYTLLVAQITFVIAPLSTDIIIYKYTS